MSHNGITLAPELRAPTLVLHGDRDREVPREEVQELVGALPTAELMTFPDAGHMVPLTHGEAVAENVARWVRHVQPELDQHSPR